MHIRLKRSPAIYLAGFMGSGKSTVGRLLADQIGWDFIDIDAEIEAKAQRAIRSIFEEQGEAEFRRLESAMLEHWVRRVECGMPAVMALGGGALIAESNFKLIRDHGICIWLDCNFPSICARIAAEREQRPLARDPERFRQLFDDRRTTYARADFRVEADAEPVTVVSSIMELPLWK